MLPHTCRSALLAALLLAVSFAPLTAAAQQELRWKFREGERHTLQITQAMMMEIQVGDQPIRIKSTQVMSMLRVVEAIDVAGNAKVSQQVQRVQIDSRRAAAEGEDEAPNAPPGQFGFSYDTQADEAPTGVAAAIAPIFKALTTAKITMMISPRGKVSDVTLPPELLEAVAKAPSLPGISEMMSKDGLVQLMQQSSLEFPAEPISKGEQWESKIDLKNPAIGRQTVTTQYTYEGSEQVDGKSLERIGVKNQFAFTESPPAVKLEVTDQQADGFILFDNEAGNLHSSESNVKMTLQVMAQGNTIVQKVTTKVGLTVQPAAEQPAP